MAAHRPGEVKRLKPTDLRSLLHRGKDCALKNDGKATWFKPIDRQVQASADDDNRANVGEVINGHWRACSISSGRLCSRSRRGPNFQFFLNRQLRPLLALPKEEFAILFITSPLTNYLVAVGAPAAQKLGRRSRQTRFHLGRFALRVCSLTVVIFVPSGQE